MAERMQVRSLFREYTVEIGADAVEVVTAAIPAGKSFVVCDARVSELWGNDLAGLLSRPHMLVAPREESKTIENATELLEAMVAASVRRDHTVIAIGGGITQDLTAFAASILYRGINWAFIPTTLLAQADSCIGSKTSINLRGNKNLVGNFWPPSLAVIDTKFLTTLPADDVRSGIGEMLHFYLYADSPLTRPLTVEHDDLVVRRSRLLPYIRESLRIKKGVAEIDEFDRHERHKFNYGHTFGHALESLTEYSIPHGLAVTVGMDIANFISVRLGLMPQSTFDELHGLLSCNMPARPHGSIDVNKYSDFLARDKKNLGGSVGCILAERAGALITRQVPLDARFRSLLSEYFDGGWWRA